MLPGFGPSQSAELGCIRRHGNLVCMCVKRGCQVERRDEMTAYAGPGPYDAPNQAVGHARGARIVLHIPLPVVAFAVLHSGCSSSMVVSSFRIVREIHPKRGVADRLRPGRGRIVVPAPKYFHSAL